MLSDKDILKAIEDKDIVIQPFDVKTSLGPNSYDVRLGNWFYFPQPPERLGLYNPFLEASVRAYWGNPIKYPLDGNVIIRPGVTVLAHTLEYIGTRNGYAARMHARSSVGRSGIMVCKCAGVGDEGYWNRWTMELSVLGHKPIVLKVGMRIAQMTFEYVGQTLRSYDGKYTLHEGKWTPENMLPKLWLDREYQGGAK